MRASTLHSISLLLRTSGLYIGRCADTTVHGVLVLFTEPRSDASHAYWAELGLMSCSLDQCTKCSRPTSKLYLQQQRRRGEE